MADVLIRDTALPDVVALAQNLRDADRAEMAAYGHHEPLDPLVRSVTSSMFCWSVFIDGELAAILGCAPINLIGGVGSPWMMGTPVLERHQRVLVRQTPVYISRMLRVFPHLVNFVHTENTTSVRWLRRMGFTLHEAAPYGALGAPFHKFEMRA